MKWQIYLQIYPPIDLPMDLNCSFTHWGHLGRWSGRSNPVPCRSANEYEWQFSSLSSYWQMKWQIYLQIYPTACRSANGSEWQFYLFELILSDEVADLLADLPHPPVDLPMDLNGNFTVTADIGRWSGKSTGRSTLSHIDLPMDVNGNFTVTAHIGRWSGRSTGRSTLPPCRSTNGSEWQLYCYSSYWLMNRQIPLADLHLPPVDLPMDLNGNFTVTAHIGWWSGRSY